MRKLVKNKRILAFQTVVQMLKLFYPLSQ